MQVASAAERPQAESRLRFLPELMALALLAAVLLRPDFLVTIGAAPGVQSWITIFLAIVVQATPFLVLGVVVSGAIASPIPPGWLAKVLPEQSAVAVPMAGLAGVSLLGW